MVYRYCVYTAFWVQVTTWKKRKEKKVAAYVESLDSTCDAHVFLNLAQRLSHRNC